MSGKRDIPSTMRFRREGVPMGLPGLDEWHIQQTDPEAVALARIAMDE
jgi:copper homeostasis protein